MKKNIGTLVLVLGLIFATGAFAAEVTPIDESAMEDTGTTCEDVGLVVTLKKGSRGTAVEILQEILIDAGYYNGEVDGRFGSGTRSAVKMLQTAVGVKADGVVGPVTREAMRELCVGYVQGS